MVTFKILQNVKYVFAEYKPLWYLHMVANRQTTFENISPQFLLLYYEIIPIWLILAPDHRTGLHILSIFDQKLRENIF